jgi:DNA-directed RNA polymerase sigma subunit (sigma70/sigma32)
MIKEESFNEDKITLQDIGDIFKVTRMRICQIEKNAIKKLKDKISSI